MSRDHPRDVSAPIAWTLDLPARGDPEDEFRRLFARALQSAERPDPRMARFLLDPAVEPAARDLFEREQRCCAFFAFVVSVTDDALIVDARVPTDAEESLDFLLSPTVQQ